MLSTCMQGQTGPNALYPGFGQLMAALSGFYHISGYAPGEPPSPPTGPIRILSRRALRPARCWPR